MTERNTMTTVLDRLTAWVEKQSSIGPAAFKQALAEIRRDVDREERGRLDSSIALQHEAFETAKRMLTANPVLKRRLHVWLEGRGSSLADVDAAIETDKLVEPAATESDPKPTKKRAAKPRKVKA
jgi:hypothetical protein